MTRPVPPGEENPQAFLGIEGGATRTTVILADGQERELLQLSEPAANQRLMTDRELSGLLRGIAAKVAAASPALTAVCIGLAGTRKRLAMIYGESAALHISNRDGMVVTEVELPAQDTSLS